MIINSTLNFVKSIKDTNFEKPLLFECFYASELILLAVTSSFIALSLIKLINSRDQRQIDKLIKFQTFVLNITGYYLFLYYFSDTVSPFPLKEYIGQIGCDATDMIMNFSVGFVQSQSFFMALYRYLCIIHCDFFDGYNISGKVSEYFHTIALFPLFQLISLIFIDACKLGHGWGSTIFIRVQCPLHNPKISRRQSNSQQLQRSQ